MALAGRAACPFAFRTQHAPFHAVTRSMSSARRAPALAGLKLLPGQPRPLGYGPNPSQQHHLHRQQIVVQSFLGVGAPEAILVAVVALVVFGPKGLADAAKSLGQTLRAFQPTIREVVEVSQEIKGTLEQELGLDEIRQAASMRPTPRPMPTSSSDDTAAASSSSSSNSQPISEQQALQLDPEIELKRAMSEQAAWGGEAPAATSAAATAGAAASASGSRAAPGKDLSGLSLEDLEAELAKRKSQSA